MQKAGAIAPAFSIGYTGQWAAVGAIANLLTPVAAGANVFRVYRATACTKVSHVC